MPRQHDGCGYEIASNGADWDGVQVEGKSETTTKLRSRASKIERVYAKCGNSSKRLHVLTIEAGIVKLCNSVF